MVYGEDAIQSLRQAIEVSPDNIPLREHLAQTLLSLGRFAEAEQELRDALAVAPDHKQLKVSLSNAYYQQEKNSQALVVIEDLSEKR